MKRILLSVTLLLAFCAVNARPIGQTEAQELATRFMKRWVKRPVMRMLPSSAMPAGTRSSNGQAPFYIYNNDGGKGFVIVSGDDAIGTILGYSDHGTFTFKDAPDNLLFWMKTYAKRIAAIRADEKTEERMAEAPHPVVKPLLGDIKWGQDAPYNNDGPTWTDGQDTYHYYVGCVATAASQIMRYYKYPLHGTGSHSYTTTFVDENGKPLKKNVTLSADFSKDTYEWDKMLPDYRNVNYTAEQAKAVALLNAHVAISVDMEYGLTGSGTYSPLVPYAMRTYFGYDKSVQYLKREHYSTNEWMTLIKHELDARRPVYYSASSEDGLGGHAFVCDGYDSRDFVHINWGWHGDSDGFFMVNHLNPEKLGIGADKSGFNVGQEILINFVPAGSQVSEVPLSVSSPTRLSVMLFNTEKFVNKSMSLACFIENYDVEPAQFRISAVLMKDGQILKHLKDDNQKLAGYTDGKAGHTYYIMRDIPLEVAGVADGEYQVCFAICPVGQDKWTVLRHPVGNSAYGVVKVEKGVIVADMEYKPTPDVKLLSKINFDGPLYADGAGLVRVKLQNKSKDFNLSKLIFKFTSTADPQKVYTSDTLQASIYGDCTENYETVFALPEQLPAGRYAVKLYHAKYDALTFDDSEVGTTEVDVRPAAAHPVLRQVSEMGWLNADTKEQTAVPQGKKIVLACDMRNYGKDGNASVVTCFKSTLTGKEYVFMEDSKDFDKGEKQTMKFYKPLPFEPGTYKVGTKYVAEDVLEDMPCAFDSATVTIEKNAELPLECAALDFPTTLELGKAVTGSFSLKALKDVKNMMVKVALRTFTGRGGVLLTMTRVSGQAGTQSDGKLNYTPREGDIAPGFYLMQITCKAGLGKNAVEMPVGGCDNYYKLVRIVKSTTGITEVRGNAAEDGLTVRIAGNRLRLQPESDAVQVREVSVYTLSGMLVSRISGDVRDVELPRKASTYILKVVTNKGIVVKKFITE